MKADGRILYLVGFGVNYLLCPCVFGFVPFLAAVRCVVGLLGGAVGRSAVDVRFVWYPALFRDITRFYSALFLLVRGYLPAEKGALAGSA